MAKGATFQVAIKLISDQFTKGIRNIERQIKGLGGFIKGAFALGTITAFGKQMIQVSSEFEDAMARVHAVSNATAEDFKRMSEEARRLGATTKFTATEAANALENLTRNGLTAKQATTALSGTLKLAQANAIGLAEAANITTNVMNMFGLTTRNTEQINDVLSRTAANSATNITQLYEALANAAPTAHNLNISLEEVSAALGSMAQRGVKGAESGTQLRMALTKMVDPKIVAKMNEMGVAIDEQSIRNEGLLKTIQRLKDANLELSDLVKIFSQRGAQGMAQLINAYNDFDRLLLILKDDERTTSRMFQQGIGSTKNSLLMLKSAYQELLITIGESTRGPFNTIIKYLTDVVKNCKTLGGMFANLASVVIPLFASKVVSAMLTFKAEMAKGVASALALKAAMGNVIGIVASLVTWIGTNMVLSLTRTNREIKQLDGEMLQWSKDCTKARHEVGELVNKLGTSYDKDTLNGVVREACKMFPDFRDRILEAARAADDTKSYDKLKGVLREILSLQAAVSANAVLTKLADTYTQKIADELMRIGKNFAGTSESVLYETIKSTLGKAGKGDIGAVYYAIADSIGRSGTLNEAFDSVREELKAMGIAIKEDTLRDLVSRAYASDNAEKVAATYDRIGQNQKVILADEEKQQEAARNAAKTAQETETKEEAAANAATKRKNAAEKLAKIDDKFNQEIANAEDDLLHSYITFDDYIKKLAAAAKQAYEDFRDETGKTGEDNKYFESRERINQRVEKHEALKGIKETQQKYKGVVGKVETKEELPIKVHPIVDIPEVGMTIDEGLESFWTGFKTGTDAINQFGDALGGLERAYDTLTDSTSSFFDRIKAVGDIMESTKKAVNGVLDVITLLGDAELASIAKETMVGKIKRREAAKDVAANTAKAGSGAAASVASIPYVGPFLAGAAVASILALLAASLPKFEKGGIIRGNSKYGDRLLARVNAGEAVLTQRQQKNFMDLANGKIGGAQQVQFHISGKDLKGVLRNIDNSNSRISGSRGL